MEEAGWFGIEVERLGSALLGPVCRMELCWERRMGTPNETTRNAERALGLSAE